MSLDPNKVSIVHWFPDIEKHQCGYCKQENCSISYGMWAETMTVQDYQNLIDRGWRRSGKYCYKPIMNETCCPQYTIRCDALAFRPSKSQKKIIKKFNKYLADGGALNKESHPDNVDCYDGVYSDVILKDRPQFAVVDLANLKGLPPPAENGIQASCSSHHVETKPAKKVKMSEGAIRQGVGADPSKPPCKKAKLIRLEKKQKKSTEPNRNDAEKTLDRFLNEIPEGAKHRLQMKLISTSGSVGLAKLDVEYDVYRKYQTIIHNDPPEKCSRHGFVRFLVTTPLKMRSIRMDVHRGSFAPSARLFAKYQMVVHDDDSHMCDEKQFFEFLVDTPFQAEVDGDDESKTGFGSFHQQYWLDDKLIAVGVVDILPRCISSVYFFYDPDYRSFTLGTYGSLRELEFARSLNVEHPSIKHYYMGFYIYSCPKMRYKGNLRPSELLCPETYRWFPMENCVAKLEAAKYARLNENADEVDDEACSRRDVEQIKVLFGYNVTTFQNYKFRNRDGDVFENIGRLVGKRCADTVLFVNERR